MNHKRNKPRTKTHHTRWSSGSRTGEAPRYWNILFNNRPKRRKDKRTNRRVLMGELHPDNVTWELGNRKPHEYYW